MSYFARMTPLQKAGNPYHASNGQFTSAGNVGSAGPKTHQQLDDNGYGVTIKDPHAELNVFDWQTTKDPVTFVPGGHAPGLYSWIDHPDTADEWNKVYGQNPSIDAAHPFTPSSNPAIHTSAGCLIKEPDGRVWLCCPTNKFGGYDATFPKGTVEHDLSMQASAIKETFEETGLKVKIVGFVGDYDKTTSRTRLYLAERVGGSPADMGWESQAVHLVSPDQAKMVLNKGVDLASLEDADGVKVGATTPTAASPSPGLSLNKVAEAKGSNPGGVFEDKYGQKHYVKFYADPDQGRVEQLASSIYEQMGCRTPTPRVMSINGQTALVTKWDSDLQKIHPSEFTQMNPTQQEQVAKMFAASVLTKNWDVVGLAHDNIVRDKTTGDMVEVDTGGAFHFRAQGEPKPYGPDIAEHASLQDTQYPAGQVFSTLFKQSPGLMQKATEAVKNLDMESMKTRFEKSGLPNQAELFKSFSARRDALLAKGGVKP